jgi:3'(2'), 5'-bisphosphate nucleotidase
MDSISLSPLPLLLPSTPPSATTIPNETTDNNPQQQRQQRVWILDPIDGTQGLLTNQEYAVGLALRNEQGELVVGVLGNPARTHAVMVAVQNEGIRFWNPNDNDNNDENGTWIQLEETQEDDDEQKHNSKSYKNWIQYQENYQLDGVQSTNNADTTSHPTTTTTTFWNHSPGTRVGIDYPPYLMSRPNTMGSPMPFGPHCPPVHLCCGSLVKYFAVARGEVAGFIQHQHDHLNSWDHAAGILCVQEAGGSVQDGQGQAIQIRAKQFEVTRGIVACASSASQPVRYHLQASLQWE